VLTGSEVKDVNGFVGNFKTLITNGNGEREIDHGVTIIATGAHSVKPDEYLYKKSDRVFRWHELEKAISKDPGMVTNARAAVFIQCVGSREPQRPYCSKICCTHSVQMAVELKKMNPDMSVFILYRDIRTYGPREDLYREARKRGVIFIRYTVDNKPTVGEVIGEDGQKHLEVTVMDHVLGRRLCIEADFINLATAIYPRDHEEIARLFKVPLNEDGFFVEAHAKLRPVDLPNDGIFVAGMAHYPKPIEESIAQAQAAAARAVTLLSRQTLSLAPTTSFVDQEKCIGCGVCEQICSYTAIRLTETPDGNIKAQNIPGLCKGCGLCAASCPQKAIDMHHFRDAEIMAWIDSIAAA